MKKLYRIIPLFIVIFLALPLIAFADMGPKPEIHITVINPPREKYYLDILEKSSKTPSNKATYTGYNKEMAKLLRSFEKDKWYPVALYGGLNVPMWGDIESDDDSFSFGYVGTPDSYRVIIVTESGTVKTSRTIKKLILHQKITVDFTDMSITMAPVWQIYPAQLISTLLPTLVIEFIILLLFGFKAGENIKVFLLTNIATQIAMTICLSSTLLFGGDTTFYCYLIFIPVEIAIALTEGWIYEKHLKGHNIKRRFWYGVTANAVSGASTFFSLRMLIIFLLRFI